MGRQPSSVMMRFEHFSTTTMASVHQQADDNDQGEHVRVLMEKRRLPAPQGAEQHHRHGDCRNQGGAEVLQEEVDNDKDQADPSIGS